MNRQRHRTLARTCTSTSASCSAHEFKDVQMFHSQNHALGFREQSHLSRELAHWAEWRGSVVLQHGGEEELRFSARSRQ